MQGVVYCVRSTIQGSAGVAFSKGNPDVSTSLY